MRHYGYYHGTLFVLAIKNMLSSTLLLVSLNSRYIGYIVTRSLYKIFGFLIGISKSFRIYGKLHYII